MSEDRDTRKPSEDLGGPGEERGAGREQQVRLLGGGIACIVGLLFGVGSVLAAFVGGTPNVSGGALGAALGILGYFLGSRRLATATVVLCVAAIFFALAASQGLIPGIQAFDRSLPGVQPSVDD